MSGNLLSDVTAVALARGLRLRGMPELQDLRLNHNRVGNEGARALAEAIGEGVCPTLSDLWLGANRISDGGAAALARMLSPASHGVWSVTTLALYSNTIGDGGAMALLDAVEGRLRVREHQLASRTRAVPLVTVLLFGHAIQSEHVVQRMLHTPGMEVRNEHL